MSKYLIRNAAPSDASVIAKIHVRTWQCAYRGQIPDSFLDAMSVEKRKERWQQMIEHPDKGAYALVAEEKDKIVGWCTGGPSRDEDADKEMGELQGIYIDPEYIGKGVGTALMNNLLDILRKDKYKEATLWVLDTNEKARAFYEKKGWSVEGKTKREPRDGFEMHEVRYIIKL